jgi:hypothetical protein
VSNLALDWTVVAYLVLGTPTAGVALGYAVDAASHMRSIRRTGHVRDCPGARGWDCSCRDS